MPKVGRNDPCPCGSGKKYKQCCLLKKSSNPLQKLHWWLQAWRPDWFNLITLGLIIVLASAAYYNSFSVPFVFDDGSNIVHNRGVHLASLKQEDGDIVRLKSSIARGGRGTSQISFAINYYFGKLNPWGYHLVNLIIHILCAWVIFKFTLMTLSLPSMRDRYGSQAREIAAGCALIFAVHPVNTQAVTYIVQRATSLAALFSLLCLIYYAKGRLRVMAHGTQNTVIGLAYFAVLIISFLLSYSSKQTAVMLPIIIGLYEFYFFQQLDLSWIKRHWFLLLLVLAIPLIVGMVIIDFNLVGWISKEYAKRREFTFPQRVLTEWRVVIYYITLMILPLHSRLNLDYTSFPLSNSLIDPSATLFSLLLIIGLLGLAVYIAKREPLVSFFILWFFVNLALESSVLALDLVYDHRLYLPGIGFLIIAVWGVERLLQALPKFNHMAIKAGLLLPVIVTLSVMTYKRNQTWQSVISILEDVVKKAPDNARQHVNLGVAYSDVGMLDKATEQYLLGIKLDPNYPEAYNDLGNAYNRKGMYQKAVKEYLRAIRMRPDYKEAHNNLGSAYCNMGKYDMAIQEHLTALKINPECEKSHNNLGVAYSFKRMYDKAIAEYTRALEIKPEFLKSRSNLGLAYSFKGMYDKAIEEYKKVLQINPNDVATNYNLGNIYNDQGKSKLAAEAFRRVLAAKPNHAEAHNNLGLAYKNLGDFSRAETEIKLAIKLRHNVPEFYFNLGLVYKESNRYDKAQQAFNQTLQLKPSFALAHYHLGIIAEAQGNYKLASQRYQQAIRANSKFALAYKNLGLLHLNQKGDPSQALKLLKHSLTLFPTQPDAVKLKKLVTELELKSAS